MSLVMPCCTAWLASLTIARVKLPYGSLFTFNILWIDLSEGIVKLFNPVLNEEKHQDENSCE